MRKGLIVAMLGIMTVNGIAQDGGAGSKVRFGLKVLPSIDWMKSDDNIVTSNGVAARFGGGLAVEYKLTDIISIQTGLQIENHGGKVKYENSESLVASPGNSVSYMFNTLDGEIVKFDEALISNPDYQQFQLNERKFSTTYITLPIGLKMKTKEIGMFTYFGEFGVNNSFRWTAKATDEVQPITGTDLGTEATKTKLDIKKDVSLYTASLNMGLGAELNLSGSTSFVFGMNYLLGFTNTVKKESDYLERQTTNNAGTVTLGPLEQSIKTHALVLTLGVLF